MNRVLRAGAVGAALVLGILVGGAAALCCQRTLVAHRRAPAFSR